MTQLSTDPTQPGSNAYLSAFDEGYHSLQTDPNNPQGLIDTLTTYGFDTVRGVGRGVLEGLQSPIDFADDVAEAFGGDLYDESYRVSDVLGETTTSIGAFSEGLSEFATVFIPIAGQISRFKTVQNLGKLGKYFAKDVLGGAAADILTTNPGEKRLSDLIEEHAPGLSNPVTQYLQSSGNETDIEARLMGSLEGAVTGPMLDLLFIAAKGVKNTTLGFKSGGAGQARHLAEQSQAALSNASLAHSTSQQLDPVIHELGIKANEAEVLVDRVVTPVAHTFGIKVHELLPDIVEDSRKLVTDLGTPYQFIQTLGELGMKVAKPKLAPDALSDDFVSIFSSYIYEPHRLKRGADARLAAQLKDLGSRIYRMNVHKLDDATREELDRLFGVRTPRRMFATDEAVDYFADRVEKIATGQINAEDLLHAPDAPLFLAGHLDFNAPIEHHFNSEHLQIGSGPLALVEQAVEATKAKLAGRTTLNRMNERGLRTLANAAGDATGAKPAQLLAHISQDAQDATARTTRFVAGMHLMTGMSEEIHRRSIKMATDPASVTGEDREIYARMLGGFVELASSLKNIERTSGQLIASRRIDVPSAKMDPHRIEELLALGNTGALQDFAVKLASVDGDVKSVRKMLEKTTLDQGIDIANEWWINAILSGHRTHVVNITSTFVNTVINPLEQAIGAASSGDLKTLRETGDLLFGLVGSIPSALKYMGVALKRGETILDPTSRQFADSGARRIAIGNDRSTNDLGELAIRARRTLSGGDFFQTALDYVGNFVRLPGRFLAAEDEFFKQLNYKAHVYASVHREAREMVAAGTLKQADRAEWIAETIEAATDQITGKALNSRALKYAEHITFTERLEGGVAKTMEQAANAHPILRQIIPFIRTPTNILYQATTRIPGLRTLNKAIRDELNSPDPQIAARARGRLATGYLLTMGTAVAAIQGRVTGAGPSDPEQKALLRATGWQPYSIITTDQDGNKTYTSYLRLDPFASVLGLVADAVEMSNRLDAEAGEEAQAVFMSVAASVSNNLTDKTYLRGLAELGELLSGRDDYAIMNVLRNRAASFAAPNFLNHANDLLYGEDNVLRDTRLFVDKIRKAYSGSAQLTPKRNVLGDVMYEASAWGPDLVSPFAQTKDLNQTALDELSRLRHGFRHPQPRVNGVDLRKVKVKVDEKQTAYDRWLELTGSVSPNDQKLKQRLAELIKSPAYQKLPDAEDVGEFNSPRIRVLQRVISAYRRAAFTQLLRENPELASQIKKARIAEAAAQAGKLVSDSSP